MEDKEEIVKALVPVIRLTRAGTDIVNLEYVLDMNDERFVVITFENGARKMICVSANSGIAIIEAIIKCIAYGGNSMDSNIEVITNYWDEKYIAVHTDKDEAIPKDIADYYNSYIIRNCNEEQVAYLKKVYDPKWLLYRYYSRLKYHYNNHNLCIEYICQNDYADHEHDKDYPCDMDEE